MKNHHVLAVLLTLALATACSEDPVPNTPSTGGAAATGGGGTAATGGGGTAATGGGGTAATGGGGTAATGGGDPGTPGECVNQGDINYECPFNLPPIDGSCAPTGTCCRRASNNAKIAALGPDEPAVIEYRLNFVDITNQPLSAGLPALQQSAGLRAEVCSGEQCLLWRFTMPRAGGQFVAGEGEVEIGIGAYNCDGTYSFYGPSAAPDRTPVVEQADPGRWQSVSVPAMVDPTKTNVERFHIPWTTNRNRETARSIFLVPEDNSIDWELASSGFEITEINWTDEAIDCIGTRNGFVGWNTVIGFESYSPLVGNNKDISNQTNQTYCSLLAFGLLPEGMKEKDCINTPRCMPDGGSFGDGSCEWIKLPDALCPTTEAEQALFGCHLGAEGNPNQEEGYPAALNCTPTAPTTPQNPDMGVTTKGQCCDPMGQSTTLPACNAYRTVGKFVAAASEITDQPRDSLPPICQ